ncbi:hypothetical protein TSOC_000492 [Tetrabaena socialis]|uniref:Uncharacterized protein n=1 Tax=Tetrabaena socialis TaxID=47790 RepID=A0A2J8AJ62_9CHLO|nr:hypothetical protein TSOC_000492 [Tetrabaena socialis]|eukprot:PNH12562.1 hypothetical protein TSOC_000492 [Tetrabaena socialis]
MLEIGSFQGRSALWALQNVLTHPESEIWCCDTFAGTPGEHSESQVEDLHSRFMFNIREHASKVNLLKGFSYDMLKQQPWATQKEEHFDIVYIDGDHQSRSAMEDAVLTYRLLKPGGVVIFDDYMGGDPTSPDYPKLGIDGFMTCYADSFETLHPIMWVLAGSISFTYVLIALYLSRLYSAMSQLRIYLLLSSHVSINCCILLTWIVCDRPYLLNLRYTVYQRTGSWHLGLGIDIMVLSQLLLSILVLSQVFLSNRYLSYFTCFKTNNPDETAKEEMDTASKEDLLKEFKDLLLSMLDDEVDESSKDELMRAIAGEIKKIKDA